ncbi:MAG TPA: SRPBCC domain-containing protein [Vicinamibacterales bacterium]|jgi:uncharacterized protein YndB with AHSA1/START domain|nr:SRPBCC domain-containing protein [Vicinamibacterales bacterium]
MTAIGHDTIVEEISIAAPAAKVFDAIVEPAQRAAWWGAPDRFQTTHMESDLRPGGRWSMGGIGMNGGPFVVRGEYRVVDRPRVVEFTWLPDWQADAAETVVRIELEETQGVTRVRLIHSGLTDSGRASHRGWPQVLTWLRTYAERNDATARV